jgi:hypothetical protein
MPWSRSAPLRAGAPVATGGSRSHPPGPAPRVGEIPVRPARWPGGGEGLPATVPALSAGGGAGGWRPSGSRPGASVQGEEAGRRWRLSAAKEKDQLATRGLGSGAGLDPAPGIVLEQEPFEDILDDGLLLGVELSQGLELIPQLLVRSSLILTEEERIRAHP